LRNVFAVAAAAVTNAYMYGGLILSLGSQVARDPVGSPNTLVNGAALSLFAIASAVVRIGARRLQPRAAMTGGAAASTLGMVLLAAAVAHHNLPVFLAATAISGAAYSLLFFGGLQTINSAAPIRLPPQVNRISGVVRQLAIHLRSNPDASQKTQRVFGIV
jgi:hypothetical protein